MELYRTETYKQLQVLNLLEIVMVSRGGHRGEQQIALHQMKSNVSVSLSSVDPSSS